MRRAVESVSEWRRKGRNRVPAQALLLQMKTIGQERVLETLHRAVAGGRVAHAYLFHGPDGTGKRAVALYFAQALLCERGSPAPCGTCNACSRVLRLIHPDVHVLFPHPTDVSDDEVNERRRLLAQNPYAVIDFVRRPSLTDAAKASNRQAHYTIARVHEELHRPMSFRPVEGRYKVAVVIDADLMRVEAANAFLKLLEEPTPQTVFLLTTARPDRLLPTIASRCQKLRFDLLESDAIAEALVEGEGLDPTHATLVARMADGSYAQALDLAVGDDLAAQREQVVAFLRDVYRGGADAGKRVETMAALGREQAKNHLRLMLRWVRDLVLFREMGVQAPLVNVDQAESIARFSRNLPAADLPAMVLRIEEALELIERNTHATLVFQVLSQRLSLAMRGGRSASLFVPLAES